MKPIVTLIDEATTDPRIRAVFDDIKSTRKITFIPAIWRALATNPTHLELSWTRVKAIMQPGKLDLITKEMIAVAVSMTNMCGYCINSHTAAAQKLGMDDEMLGEMIAVIGLYNEMNKLAVGFQLEPDVLPLAARQG